MSKAAIIDYGMGNIDSVKRAVEFCGGDAFITSSEKDISEASHIILPGVGAFPDAIKIIKIKCLDKILKKEVFIKKKFFLGLCLGMQLMATKGYEVEKTVGLGWFDAEVTKLVPQNNTERIPHVGWNEVLPTKESVLFKDIHVPKDFYFVHSFHVKCKNEEDILAITPYCKSFASVINKDNIFGAQFHPEKSQKVGLQFLRNFLELSDA